MAAPAGPDSLREIPACPICDGRMELVYDRLNQQVCVCTDCHSGLTIPAAAWDVQLRKRNRSREPQE